MDVACMLAGLALLGVLAQRFARGPGHAGLISGMGVLLIGGYLHTF